MAQLVLQYSALNHYATQEAMLLFFDEPYKPTLLPVRCQGFSGGKIEKDRAFWKGEGEKTAFITKCLQRKRE